MQIVLFEDARTEQLDPVAVAEPAFSVTCGSYKLAFLLRSLGPIWTIVRKQLRGFEAASFPERVPPPGLLPGPWLFVNARLVPSISVLTRLKSMADDRKECVVTIDECIAAAYVKKGNIEPTIGDEAAFDITPQLKALNLPPLKAELPLIEYPHDLLRHHMACCRSNLEYRLQSGFREVRDGVWVGDNVTLGEYLVADTKQGPIVIDQDATIGQFCSLRGPIYIGAKSKVVEYASIKDCVTMGHTTKVGGEVEGSIIEPYSNKVHHGYLGHSYVGSWVNIGAGTCNSDLKNTYGSVTMEYGERKIDTGMQFVGCFIGDYVKTAINTSIFTGKTVGVCSMIYGFVTTNVPAFCNYARSFGQMTEVPPDVMIAIQKRMFARRQVQQRACDIQLIQDLYALARQKAPLPTERLSF